ncbi:uncharacterized protein [Henckelia pumila]|uniref:uncharacterized protein n=1 Tax=Henckelia pumila TaxID=405737 RepID=UPI003C6E0CD3
MKEEEITCKFRRLEKLAEDRRLENQTLRQMFCETNGMMTKNIGIRVDGELDKEINDGQNVKLSYEEAKYFDENLGGYDKYEDVDVVTDFSKGDGVGLTKLDVEVNNVLPQNSSRGVDESDKSNDVAGSQVDAIDSVISSIVKNVMTRTDRVKKRKPNMFVTPPSSTPRRKKKSIKKNKDLTLISDEGDTSSDEQKLLDEKIELELKKYKGREDFCGCEEVSEKDRKIIIDYLTGEKLRFLFFPIFSQSHWFLLLYKVEKKEFELWNSIDTAKALGSARAYARFLVGYMRIMCGYNMGEDVNRVMCRQQGADMDCGVYTCLWVECYSRDDDVAWTHEKDCTMNSVRARIAASILIDSNGVFGRNV